jgi:hypothetical protein
MFSHSENVKMKARPRVVWRKSRVFLNFPAFVLFGTGTLEFNSTAFCSRSPGRRAGKRGRIFISRYSSQSALFAPSSKNAVRFVLQVTRLRSGRTVSYMPIARRSALGLFTSGRLSLKEALRRSCMDPARSYSIHAVVELELLGSWTRSGTLLTNCTKSYGSTSTG